MNKKRKIIKALRVIASFLVTIALLEGIFCSAVTSEGAEIKKHVGDVEEIKKIIKQQRAQGAYVSRNLDHKYQYGWNAKTGRLEKINWSSLGLTDSLDLNKLESLKYLYCARNDLIILEVEKLKSLKELDCHGNKIKKLDVNKLKKVYYLDCSSNEIKKLDVNKLKKIYYLDCSFNKIKKLEVANLKSLKTLRCLNNQLKNLDVDKLKN